MSELEGSLWQHVGTTCGRGQLGLQGTASVQDRGCERDSCLGSVLRPQAEELLKKCVYYHEATETYFLSVPVLSDLDHLPLALHPRHC